MHLRRADGRWPYVLAHTVAAIVPKRVFPARRLLADKKVIGSGPYKLGRYVPEQQAVLTRNPRYAGPAAKTKTVTVRYFADGAALKGAIEGGDIDVAFAGFSAAEIAHLRTRRRPECRCWRAPAPRSTTSCSTSARPRSTTSPCAGRSPR